MRLVLGAGGVRSEWWPYYLPSMVVIFVGNGAGVERQAVDVAHGAQTRRQFRFDVELQQLQHLRVAVLLDHVNPVVMFR